MTIHVDEFAATPSPKPVRDSSREAVREPAPRVVSAGSAFMGEEALERALRPKQLDEYVGQAKAREQLEIFISAAKKRSEALDHVLLFGPRAWARPRCPTSLRPSWA